MSDLRNWLESIGLGQYADLFAQNDIDRDVLADLGERELKSLGVSLGHQKKLLKALAEQDRSHIARTDRASEVQRLAASATVKPERRHLTVMFCDLVGSTALSAQLDPEDLREILRAFQRCSSDSIRQYGGHIARFLGDGVLAYFGFPQAREGDAEGAVNAGLKIVESVAAITSVRQLQVRIGIATGLVVAGDLIGEGSAAEFALVGDAPNLAATARARGSEPDLGGGEHASASGQTVRTSRSRGPRHSGVRQTCSGVASAPPRYCCESV